MSTTTMTAQWVERVKPPTEGRAEWFDSKVVGLGLRVSSSGKKSWFVMYRSKGDPKKRRLTLEPYPVMTLADAREKAQAVILAAAKGADPAGKRQEERRSPTFGELARDYLERYAKSQKRSWKEDQRIIERDLIPSWGHRKAFEVRRRDVIDLLDKIKDRGAPIQANRTLALVRKIYNWAISRDIVETNPCLQVKAVAPERQRDRVLSEEELCRLWAAFGAQDIIIGSIFKLRLMTAQRGGEIETMRWAEVDLANGWWTIPAERSKNKLSHRVPLAEPAIALLEQLKPLTGHQEWVFPSPSRRGRHITNVQKAADRLKERSGVDFVPHDLRRTAASYMTSMGISRLVVSKILNHVEQGVTRVYDRHSYDAEKRVAMTAWAERLLEIVQATIPG